ncbi:hypothetical protein ACTFIY_009773 [Dictyostelium cf. discoideum]
MSSIQSICQILSQLCQVCHIEDCPTIGVDIECLEVCSSFIKCNQPHFHRKEYNSLEKEAKRIEGIRKKKEKEAKEIEAENEKKRKEKLKEKEEEEKKLKDVVEEERRRKKEEREKEEKELEAKKQVEKDFKIKQKEDRQKAREEAEQLAISARNAKKSRLDHLREMALGSFGKEPLSNNVLNLYKDLDEHINTENTIKTLNMCSKEILNNPNSVNHKYLNQSKTTTTLTSYGTTSDDPSVKSLCHCMDSTIFSKTSSNIGSLIMEEIKLNLSHYETVKSYSTVFLLDMVDVNTITYTIGCLSKLLPENNGKSCNICGDCSVFAKIQNALPFKESIEAISPMMAKIAKLSSVIAKIPAEIVINEKMVRCFLGLLNEKRTNFANKN